MFATRVGFYKRPPATGANYAAVGNSGFIVTSNDGITWTSRTSGTSNALNAVAYGNNRFVAVGSNSTVLVSADGIAWSSYSTPISANLLGVDYSPSLGLWVAVGADSTPSARIFTSSDAITWTNRTYTGAQVTVFNAVTWTYDNIFYTVDSSLSGPLRTMIATSSNGTSWASSSLGNIDDELNCVTSFSSSTIAAGIGFWSGTAYPTAWVNGARRQVSTTAANANARSVAYNGSLFVIGATNSRTYYSSNGTSWTQSSSSTPNFKGLCWDGSKFLGADTGNGIIASSTNGNTWTILYTNFDVTFNAITSTF